MLEKNFLMSNECFSEYLQENIQLIRHQKDEYFQSYIGHEESSHPELIV